MLVNEILNEGLLDALKFAGRTAWQAAGGKINPKSPSITRANLEYVRKELPLELYRQFVGGLIKQGTLTRTGGLTDPSKDADIVNMAADFLRQAYKVYITSPDRLELLYDEIQNITNNTNFKNLKNLFFQANAVYARMLQDVERTTVTNTTNIIDILADGINNQFRDPRFHVLKKLIKTLLADLSSTSAYQVQYPFKNSTKFINALSTAPGPPIDPTADKQQLILYQKVIEAIYDLATSKQLTIDLANYFESQIA